MNAFETRNALVQRPTGLPRMAGTPIWSETTHSEETTSLGELFGIMRRHRLLIVATMVLLAIPPTLYGLMLEKQYTAVASVVIDPQSGPASGDPLQPQRMLDEATIETQVNLLRSRSIVEQTMEDLNLFGDLEFRPDLEEPGLAAGPRKLWHRLRGEVSGPIRQTPFARSAIEDAAGSDERDVAIEAFTDRLSVNQAGQSYVLDIAFTSNDPVKAAAVTNRLAMRYVQDQLRQKVKATRKAKRWLGERLRNVKGDALLAEMQVDAYRSANPLAASGKAATELEIGDLNRRLIEIRTRQAEVDAQLRMMRRTGGLDAQVDTLSPLLAHLRVQQADLAQREAENAAMRGDLHPKTVALRSERERLVVQAQQETDRISQRLNSEIGMLASQARSMETQLAATKSRSAALAAAAMELGEREQEAATQRARIEALRDRYQEATVKEDMLEPGVRVITKAAVPGVPSTPSPISFALIGLAASTVVGGLAALLREQTNTKLRTAGEAESGLGVPCLGLLPAASGHRGVLHDLVHRQPRSPFAQAVRAIYSQLSLERAPQTILVTSALTDESKTSLAAALAVCARAEGARTLLVDFDLWHPCIARNFGVPEPAGVAEAIDGKLSDLQRALIIDEATGVHILPAGNSLDRTLPPLSRKPLMELLDQLRREYDRIIIDSPPLLGISDGRYLAACADATILAIRWDRTDRSAAVSALRILRAISANIAGTVLTQVNLRKYALYGGGEGRAHYRQLSKYHGE